MALAFSLTADRLIELFEQTFYPVYNTRLAHAKSDPEYLPADNAVEFHRICFAHGYVASALHEIAHWCVAGEARRQLADFGYWYAPDGRNEQQQQQFLQVEVKPQALEWMFSVACGKPFRVSSDNLNGAETSTVQFEADVSAQAQHWCEQGLPKRAAMWAEACAQVFGGRAYLKPQSYLLSSAKA